jgi:8-oxo-dGTP pyrophosphatase MutT (NUDIX family)
MKPVLDFLHRVRRALLKRFRVRTRGVKVMLFNEAGELLLIRNSYGRTDLWVLPGGGIHPFEKRAVAAAREVKEEVGCGVRNLRFLSTHFSKAEGKRDTVHLFRAEPVGEPEADRFEVEEARYFPLDALPDTVSDATLRRIEEHRGLRRPDGLW